jgi:hypothetical protein
VFAVGDGYAAIDDEIVSLDRGGPPDYPAYAVLGRTIRPRLFVRGAAARVAVATYGFDEASLRRALELRSSALTRHLVVMQRAGAFTDDGAIAVAAHEVAP